MFWFRGSWGGLDFVFLLFDVLSVEKPLWLEQSPTSGGGGFSPGRGGIVCVLLSSVCWKSLAEAGWGWGGHC